MSEWFKLGQCSILKPMDSTVGGGSFKMTKRTRQKDRQNLKIVIFSVLFVFSFFTLLDYWAVILYAER